MYLKNLSPFVMTLSLVLILLFSSCEVTIDPPEQSISYEKAKTMQNEYVTTRGPILREGLNFVDTRDIWFSLDTLKHYIEYVEAEARKQDLDNLGIRIYYAAYTEPQGNDEHAYSTVVLVPTSRSSSSNLQKGFMPIVLENENIPEMNALNYGHGGQPPKDL